MDSAKSIRFCGGRTWGLRDVGRLLFLLRAVQASCERKTVYLIQELRKRTLSNFSSGWKLALDSGRWPNPRGTPTLFDIPPGWFV
jgi:hypothetical protein